jgi:hypothetical protein
MTIAAFNSLPDDATKATDFPGHPIPAISEPR